MLQDLFWNTSHGRVLKGHHRYFFMPLQLFSDSEWPCSILILYCILQTLWPLTNFYYRPDSVGRCPCHNLEHSNLCQEEKETERKIIGQLPDLEQEYGEFLGLSRRMRESLSQTRSTSTMGINAQAISLPEARQKILPQWLLSPCPASPPQMVRQPHHSYNDTDTYAIFYAKFLNPHNWQVSFGL